jgi:dihydrofolate reductase
MISIIVAISKNGVIGKNNEIPWYLPDDLKHFAKITTDHTVVMGRKTYESIINRLGKPLPNRKNIILTSQKDFQAPDCLIKNTVSEILEVIPKDEEVFIIGGAKVYEDFLPFTNKLYITKVDTDSDGDIKFPEYNENDWNVTFSENHSKDEKNPFDFSFLELSRK